MPTKKPKLNVTPDAPDLRDRYYEPSLRPLKKEISPPFDLHILDQGSDGACTGFGLAAVINYLYDKQSEKTKVSPWMLYHMARRYDEWAGEDYQGSSCRGAIKGWKNTGVCEEAIYPAGNSGQLGFDQLENAKSHTIGAYYRVRPEISEMHAAVNETEILYVSANVHNGWMKLSKQEDAYVIEKDDNIIGGHAFAIVGYNERGFWVQNSWGKSWGNGGIALWLYEDWLDNVYDAWVLQLSLPTPQIFNNISKYAGANSTANRSEFGAPDRKTIWKHFIHFDDGTLHDKGRYWSNLQHVEAIAENIKQTRDQFDHLLFYGHGGLNSTKASAKRIAAMKDIFLANRIYPVHIMYDTGLMEEIKDVVIGKQDKAEQIAGGVSDWFDKRIEDMTRTPGRALWREMKSGAELPFKNAGSDGSKALKIIFKALDTLGGKVKVHTAGHSTGAILHAFMLKRAFSGGMIKNIESTSLLAPASNYALFNDTYLTFLTDKLIKNLAIYCLSEDEEKDDQVAYVYRKSLLYLVSHAFEEISTEKILGMKIFHKGQNHAGAKFIYSPCAESQSRTHGGFDNDPNTLNHVLSRMLGKTPDRPFTKADLNY